MSGRFEAIVIGASAGAVEALSILLAALPRDYALPIIIVVHVPPDKKSMLAELLGMKCRLEVREAEDKEPIFPGCVYLAAPDYHLLVEPDKRLSLAADEPVLYSRPSINVLFETAADAYGEALIGVVLTGANQDGAAGLKTIVDAGGMALVQQPATAYASAMPQAALDACKAAHVLTLEQIAVHLQKVSAYDAPANPVA